MKEVQTELLKGKKGIITGVANNLSISWAIAQLAKAHGAEIALTYPSEIFQKRVVFPKFHSLGGVLSVFIRHVAAHTCHTSSLLFGAFQYHLDSVTF